MSTDQPVHMGTIGRNLTSRLVNLPILSIVALPSVPPQCATVNALKLDPPCHSSPRNSHSAFPMAPHLSNVSSSQRGLLTRSLNSCRCVRSPFSRCRTFRRPAEAAELQRMSHAAACSARNFLCEPLSRVQFWMFIDSSRREFIFETALAIGTVNAHIDMSRFRRAFRCLPRMVDRRAEWKFTSVAYSYCSAFGTRMMLLFDSSFSPKGTLPSLWWISWHGCTCLFRRHSFVQYLLRTDEPVDIDRWLMKSKSLRRDGDWKTIFKVWRLELASDRA